MREITSVAAGADGAIYAAGIGVRSQRPSAPSIRSVQSTGMPIEVSGTLERVSQLLNEGRPQRSDPSIDAEGSEVYRIAADGQPKTIWKSDKVTAFSVAAVGDGSALVGTGSQGNIYKVRAEPPAASVLMRAAGSQVTALLHDAQGRIIYAGTSNLGRLYRAGAGYASRGSYESQVKDAGIFSKWGTLRWRQETPGGTSVKVYTRSGNTQEPDSTWSPWSEPLTQASGQKVTSPAARFFQWKAELQSGASDATPTIDNVEVAYLPRNVAPEINAVVLHQKDLAIERLPVFQDQQGLGQLSAITQVSQPGAASSASAPEPPMRQRPVPSRTSLKRGWQSMSWDARDDNGDQLVYSVYIKGEGESEWKLLKDRVEETFFSWDTTNFPDGAYTLKLAAADSPANPPDVTLIAERISDRFYIDNTAPVLSGLTASPEPGGRIRIRARANDSATWLSKAEFGVDGGELRQVFPIDGLFDSETEELDFVITNLSAGEHTIVVRVADRGNNYGSSKQIVTVR